MNKSSINFVKHCILFITTMISGCGGCDYSVDLTNGYKLVRTNAYSIFIFHEDYPYGGFNRCTVPPKIVAINDKYGVVFGLVEVSPDSDFGSTATPGYFALDTEKQKVWLGLSKNECLQVLKDYGITEEPSLVKPSRFYHMRKK